MKMTHSEFKLYSCKLIELLLLFFCCTILSSCSVDSKSHLYKKLSKEDPTNFQYQGHYKIGKKYTVRGRTYKPITDNNFTQVGTASWYGSGAGPRSKSNFHGKKTANGDKFNKHMLTCAHPKLPLPSLVKVTNLKNNKSVILMVNDRGPFKKSRIIDVSEKAATILGFKNQGVTKVKVQYLHHDTQDFLQKIALKPKENAIAKKKIAQKKCTVNCHIKLVNLKHNLAITQRD